MPPEQLLESMYQKEAARKAQIELDALKEYEARKAASLTADENKQEEKAPEEKEQEGKKLQKDLSVATIMSKNTSATLEGSVVAPTFKFGVQKQYKVLGEMPSRLGRRIKGTESGGKFLSPDRSGELLPAEDAKK